MRHWDKGRLGKRYQGKSMYPIVSETPKSHTHRRRLASSSSQSRPENRGLQLELFPEPQQQQGILFNRPCKCGSTRGKTGAGRKPREASLHCLECGCFIRWVGASDKTLANHQLLHSSASNEWRTPTEYIEAARSVLGEIHLDPASCHEANQIVRASKYYMAADDGLKQPWFGSVFLNPPYGRAGSGKSNQAIWSQRLIAEFGLGNIEQAILLVNAQTAEKWFQPLWGYPICFTDHRIRFISSSGQKKSPTHGNAFVYFGVGVERFRKIFSQFGQVVVVGGRV